MKTLLIITSFTLLSCASQKCVKYEDVRGGTKNTKYSYIILNENCK